MINSAYHLPRFPNEIRGMIKTDPYGLCRILQDNTSVRKAFNEWAKAHESFVKQSPKMRWVINKIELSPIEMLARTVKEGANKALKSLVSTNEKIKFQEKFEDELEQNHLLNHAFKEDDGYDLYFNLNLIGDYLEVGLISEQECVELLSIRVEIGYPKGSSPLHFNTGFYRALPILEFLEEHSPERVTELLSLQDKKYKQTPLHCNWEIALPFLKYVGKRSTEQLIQILSLQDGSGRTLVFLHLKDMITFWDQLSTEQFIKLLSFKNKHGTTALHKTDNIYDVIDLLKFLERFPEQLIQILSIKDDQGKTPFHDHIMFKIVNQKFPLLQLLKDYSSELLISILSNADIFKQAVPFLATLPPDQIVKFLKTDGTNTPLKHDVILQNAMPLLEQLVECSPEHLVELLSLKDNSNMTPLEYYCNLDKVTPLLTLLGTRSPEHLVKLLPVIRLFLYNPIEFEKVISFLQGQPLEYAVKYFSTLPSTSPLWNNGGDQNFRCAIPLLKKIRERWPEQLVQVFSIQDEYGSTPLHNPLRFNRAIPFLATLPFELLISLLSIRDKSGLSPLSSPAIFEKALGLFTTMKKLPNEQFMKLLSIQGSSLDLILWEPSPTWFTKPKYEADMKDVIPKADYDQRVVDLQIGVEALWVSAKEEFTPRILEVSGKSYAADEILQALKGIIDLMKVEEAWIGTPNEKETEFLHAFYSEQLLDFESVVANLSKMKDNIQTAGYLVSVATPRLEGRCAAAYRTEIEQKSLLLSGDKGQLSLDKIINNAAFVVLQRVIDRIVGRYYYGDVHAMHQYRYAVGLVPQPDSLPPITAELAQQFMLGYWNFPEIIHEFGRNVPQEFAIDWLKLQTPSDFGPEYSILFEKMVASETSLKKRSSNY